jgi:hypothetical protein
MVAVALFGLFCAGIFLAHAVDAYHARQKARGLTLQLHCSSEVSAASVGLVSSARAAG